MFRLPQLLLLLAVSAPLSAIDEQQAVRRIDCHLVLGDFGRARAEALQALQQNPSSTALHKAYIGALSSQGDEMAALAAWDQYALINSEALNDHNLFETIAWGIVSKAAASPSTIPRAIALLTAAETRDTKGVRIIASGLRDPNIIVRSMAVHVVPEMRDKVLLLGLLERLQDERVQKIKLEVVEALGNMQAVDAKPLLIQMLASDQGNSEERAVVAQALVTMSEHIERAELIALAQSPRAGLRLLACEIIAHLEMADDADLLPPLLKDHNSAVRAAATTVIGLLKVKTIEGIAVKEMISPLLRDPDPQVAVAAAWLTTLHCTESGIAAFHALLAERDPERQVMAVAALAATGDRATPLLQELFQKQNESSYVQRNLALALLARRLSTRETSSCLANTVRDEAERLQWRSYGIFRAITPARWEKTQGKTDLEAEDLMVRMEILSQIATVDAAAAQSAIKQFLGTRTWGISGIASLLLLQEGDQEAIEVVRSLLNDENQHIRVQAALALALWGKDPAALQTLEQAYGLADRELKERILTAIGKIGTRESIPFLFDKMHEPHETLRILAAAGLITVINN